MGASMRVWGRRVAVLTVLQLLVAFPLLMGALADVEPRRGEAKPHDLALGIFQRKVELGSPDRVKTLSVSVVIHLEGEETKEAAKRAHALTPKLRDAVRREVDRLDYLDLGTLRGMERLKGEVKRIVAGILDTDDVREVYFDQYGLR